ncbi:MAG: UPF0280 family protein [Deltaproteobacteria bacterium]|nr:UPF0280 family protein [Deltaproteobacteria bacterium]
MSPSEERHYRNKVYARGLVSFRVAVKETDLWVSADADLENETRDLVFECRRGIEAYISAHPEFATTLAPYKKDVYAPPLIAEMINVTRKLGVGPMASVAGAIADYVGKGILNVTNQVIVENGGDIFLKADRPVTVAILAGTSPLSEKLGLLITPKQMPLGVCSSSGSVGHSLSMGASDVVCLVATSAILGDGAATALGNAIKKKSDLEKAALLAKDIKGVLGGVVIMADRMATWGDIALVEL